MLDWFDHTLVLLYFWEKIRAQAILSNIQKHFCISFFFVQGYNEFGEFLGFF